MVIGPGSVNLSLRSVCARARRASAVHAALELQRPGDRRHHRLVAVVADAHLHLAGEVDALDASRKPCTKCWRDCSPSVTMSMPASSCSFSQSSVASRFACSSSSPPEPPGRPQLLRFGEPGRLRQAAGDGGRQQHRTRPPFSSRSAWRQPRQPGWAYSAATAGWASSSACFATAAVTSLAAGHLHRREGELDAVGVERLLDQRIGPPPDDELLAGLGHHLHADLDGEVAELLDALHLQRLDDVRRELGVVRQLLADLLDRASSPCRGRCRR